jgi:hypothetical protein
MKKIYYLVFKVKTPRYKPNIQPPNKTNHSSNVINERLSIKIQLIMNAILSTANINPGIE